MSDKPPAYVLDSYAMLAYLEGEAGMERVRSILIDSAEKKCRAFLSLINLGEVLYITERETSLPLAQAVLAAVEQLPIELLPANREAVFEAAHVKANHPVSYADAFAIAAAQECDGILVTSDPEFQAVAERIPIEWLPRER